MQMEASAATAFMASSAAAATASFARVLFFQSSRSSSFTGRRFSLSSSSGFPCPGRGSFDGRGGRSLVVLAGAKKKRNRPDSHSFVPKQDEATGPFPEAILLKKKTVEEDGRALPEFADAEEEELFEFLSLQLESDLNVDKMRHYEVVYLIHEDCVDEVDNVISKVQDFITEKKGRIWRLNNWGLRRLAYKIRKANNANYILMNFEIDAKFINEFKSMLDKDERIIRHLVMKQDEAITEDCPPPPEFHTLREQQGDDDFDDDEDEATDGDFEDEGLDNVMNLELANQDDNAYDNIIIVGGDDDDEEEAKEQGFNEKRRKLKSEKIAR